MAMAEDIRENEDIEEATSVDFDDDDQDIEIEMSSDEEAETRTNVRKDSSGDEELDSYSESVQRRINQLTAKRKQAAEEAQAAVQYAQQMQAENQQMRQRLQQLNGAYNSEAESRLNAQEYQATRALQEANEAGDYEKVAKAQQALAKIAMAKEKVSEQKARIARQNQEQEAQKAQQVQAPQQQYVQPPQQQPQRDPKLERWMEKNQWFGSDRIMTRAAQAIHEQLVLEEDYDPTSDDYYKEIDSRMRREMPHKFKDKRSNAQTVAPASGNGRSVKSGRKKSVELTPGQVAFAKKMRIPLERYAKEVARLEQNRRD
ncbi:MAG: hypothetical protein ACO20V_11825 [Alphaproteobacteria bacterium]|jgi:hypothetical protein